MIFSPDQRHTTMTKPFTQRNSIATRLLLLVLLLLSVGSVLAQKVALTLLPDYTSTSGDALPDGSLNIADATIDSRGGEVKSQSSWLYFRADALPSLDKIDIQSVQLILVRNDKGSVQSIDRAMLMRIASVPASSSKREPASWTYTGSTTDLVNFRSVNQNAVAWRPKANLIRNDGNQRYIGLLLMPSNSSASRRVYYGLRTDANKNANEVEAVLQPRLVVSYTWRNTPRFNCTSQPSLAASLQTDGAIGHISGCAFVPATNAPAEYVTRNLVTRNLASAPSVYGDLTLTLEKMNGKAMLEAWDSLNSMKWAVDVDADTEVLPGSLLTVNQFGLVRILTGSAIYTFQLKDDQSRPDPVVKRKSIFGEVPGSAFSGPDGTLYVASKGIFAINPDAAPVDASGNPYKLWWLAADSSATVRLTLSPDGNFLYFLGRIGENSRFLAINAHTGHSVELGAAMPFPRNVTTFYSPSVAKHRSGADYIFVSGNTGTQGILWAIKNTAGVDTHLPDEDEPLPTYDKAASITTVWSKQIHCARLPCIGQPALSNPSGTASDLPSKSISFVVTGDGRSRLRSLSTLAGTQDRDIDIRATNITPSGTPVFDTSGNMLFWADDSLYRFTGHTLSLTQSLPSLGSPALLFGPRGALYAVSGQSVTSIIPSYSLGSDTTITSPIGMRVTGEAASDKQWTLRAGDTIILDQGFTVKSGATITINSQHAQ